MRITLTHKFVGALVGGLLSTCLAVFIITVYFMEQPIKQEIDTNIHKFQHVIESANNITATRFAQSAKLIGHDAALGKAVYEKNHEEVVRLSQQAMAESGSDFMTVSDDQGIVVGRGHSRKWNDNVLNQETVVRAMKGEPSAAIVSGTVVPFTIRASQPIVYDGKIIGAFSIGQSLVTPPYLDWLKSLSGMEVSIFKGDACVMTTVQENGRRMVDYKVTSPEILETVLKNGQTYFCNYDMGGVMFESAWWPMRTADGKIAGMWFVGMPLSVLNADENTSIWYSILAAAGIMLIQICIALGIGLRVSAPVRKITNYVQNVAEGKETVLAVHGNDDMGALAEGLRRMVASQRQLALENEQKAEAAGRQAQEAAEMERKARAAEAEAVQAKKQGIAAAAEQIEAVVEKLNSAIGSITSQVEASDGDLQRVAGRLSETATAMEEMNSTVLAVARNAGVAADISNGARDRANVGADVIKESITGINEVHQQSISLKEGMETLDEYARSIDKVMGVISDIADQTNLLALNAAIEAARAGEAGRGFAVVADEVRKLAEKTMASTSEVGGAIQAIQRSADQSTRQVEQTVANIAQANDSATRSGDLLSEILDMVEHTADEVRAIAAASEEQSAASEEITRSMTEINELTNHTSKALQTAAAELEHLRYRSEDLVKLVDNLKNS